MKNNKNNKKKKSKLKFLIIILIVVALVIYIKNNKKNKKIDDNITPEIFYTFFDDTKIPLEENNNLFTNKINIIWTDKCTGTIKRNGKKVSDKNNTEVSEDGYYEITVSSPSGKNKIERSFLLDSTPPELQLEKQDEHYIIIFADMKDVKKAELSKVDEGTNETIEAIDLLSIISENTIEITEEGHYFLDVSDEYENNITKEFKINKKE